MESRVSSGRQATTSRLSSSCRVKRSVCRSVYRDDPSEGMQSCRFPTTDVTGQDWRAFRAHLVAWEHTSRRAAERTSQLQLPPYPPLVSGESWAHPLAEPEQGCLLLARHENMQFFSGSVILITSHDDAVGSVGYVLNKPSPLKVDELQVLGAASGFKEAFGSQRLHLGGPVHLDHVTLLHRFVGIGRSQKIADGMFMGGLADAIRLVQAGIVRPSDFHLVLGMSGWAAGQLREEISAGYWHVISASSDLVLPSTPSCAACAPMVAPEEPQPPLQQGSRGLAEGEAPGKSRPAGARSPMYKRIARLAVRGA